MFSWRWLIVVIIVIFAVQHWRNRPLPVPAGSIAPNDPVQTMLSKGTVYEQNNYKLTALADFTVEARVLSKQTYSSDREAQLAPVDLALGWGAMSDTAVLDKLSIGQSNRFYFYRWDTEPPRPASEIATHSANMHLIPTSSAVEKTLREVRVGQVVKIRGQLVEATAADGWRWRSSLTREDTGAGACELIRVESVEVQ
ncbi:hypothetical protein [Undibacterium pigrum]|uniref:Uncharacterized protein n=1 Tax=Undibacterium pigrum TaxID=401470 RepID=A0A318IMK9_9BURK|nr:hypothetical protein [Undibacterium pigrum]PXX37216.1 hypothetical protein DFR42_11837 [Undibacterium pigrum]